MREEIAEFNFAVRILKIKNFAELLMGFCTGWTQKMSQNKIFPIRRAISATEILKIFTKISSLKVVIK